MKHLLLFFLCTFYAFGQSEPWTWHYHKQFRGDELLLAKQKRALLYSKIGVEPFTQLLFSWNASRPKTSHYSFFVQVRDAHTKQWGKWHKMIEWGNDTQISFETSSDGVSRYVHVRLETEYCKIADAFKIRICVPHDDFSGFHSVDINAANMLKFEPEDTPFLSLPTVHIMQVPQQSQLVLPHEKCRMMCSPTSCSMLLGYFTKKKINPLSFAERSYDHGLHVYGNWSFNTAHAYELSEGAMRFHTARLHSFVHLHTKLMEGIPVVVSVRGEIIGAPKSYNNGHLLVVVGFDSHKGVVICHDPAEMADHETVKEYPAISFIKAWERSRRLSYIASPMRLTQL